MPTSVKLGEDAKKKLDRLQALITFKLGEKMAQQDILSALIDDALAKGDEIGTRCGAWAPLADDEFGRMRSLCGDWGVQTRWEDIDGVLYGEPKRRGLR